MLNDKKVTNLKNLIKDSFRVRPNQDPIYIDVADHLDRLKAKQHQIIFGRRGSGKSCLLVHFKNSVNNEKNSLNIYIETDEIKRLGYPDVLIRLLLSIMENTPSAKQWWRKLIFKKTSIQKNIELLRKLLDQAEHRKVKQEETQLTSYSGKGNSKGLEANYGRTNSKGILSEFEENKLDTLERYISDFKKSLIDEIKRIKLDAAYILLDDFYLLKKERQPDVLDYLHRLVRGTDFYLKVGTVRHRTNLVRNDGQTIGVVLEQDIEQINLDRTLEDLTSPTEFLANLLNSLGQKVGILDATTELFNQQAFEKLVIASGGVPRDFLTIFINAIDIAVSSGQLRHLTPTNVWKAASSFSYRNKLQNLRTDVSSDAQAIERVFRNLLLFCISDKKRTSFLISQEEAQQEQEAHEFILQLMDGKLIHVIEPDTSAASGRPGRYEAYTLDFSLFMEPRKRGIDIIEFWNFDEGGRRIGVRESPIYPLKNAKEAIKNVNDNADTESLINTIESEE
ncbi:hypothetical protein [Flavobacterium sp. DSR3-2]|uniref:hypothetical protein n=1 Tax=Flavobacterium sp. DSR3-2 TaxID=2804634 RepID=UPI003CFB3AAD